MVVPRVQVARLERLVAGTPDARLAGHVLTYTARDDEQPEPTSWRMATLGAVMVSIDLEAPDRTVIDGAARPYPRHAVAGLRDRPVTLVEEAGRSRGITVGLTPMGAYALLGMPLSELAAGDVDLIGALGARGRRLIERLGEAASWTERFRILDEQLLAWFIDAPALAVPVRGSGSRRRPVTCGSARWPTRSAGRVSICTRGSVPTSDWLRRPSPASRGCIAR